MTFKDEQIAHSVSLLLDETATSLVYAAGSHAIPKAVANRSVLIAELHEQRNGTVELPLPLSGQEVEAWLACATSSCATERDAFDDTSLLRALKAADFLQDSETAAEVMGVLSAAVEKALQGPAAYPRFKATSTARARACQIMHAAPHGIGLAIVSAVRQRLVQHVATGTPKDVGDVSQDYSRQLLQLLPRTFHTAVLQTFCQSQSDASCLLLKLRISCVRRAACSWCTAKPCACVATELQLLAAAVPLAQGSAGPGEPCLAAGRTPTATRSNGDTTTDSRGNQQTAAETPCLEHQQAQHPAQHAHVRDDRGCGLPGGDLTRLELEVFMGPDMPVGPPQWWDMLGLLRTLRELRIEVHMPGGVSALCAPELTAALRRLPVLKTLEVVFVSARSSRGWSYPTCTPTDALELLDEVSSLDSLASLSLTSAVIFPPASACAVSGPNGAAAVDVLGQLSRLSRLTRLRFASAVRSAAWTGAFAEAVKKLPALQQLEAEVGIPGTDEAAAAAEGLLLALITGAGLPSLNRLEFGSVRYDTYEVSPVFSPVLMHACMRDQNAALLTRVTALRLNNMFDVRRSPTDYGEAIAGAIADMPALKALDLGYNRLGGTGLECLARVLPSLTCLTSLNVSFNCSEESAVLDVLSALLEPAAAGRERLRELDISGNPIGAQSAQALADRLRGFYDLEVLTMRSMSLGEEGMRVVAEVLKTLPQLRWVYVSSNLVEFLQTLLSGHGNGPDTHDDA